MLRDTIIILDITELSIHFFHSKIIAKMKNRIQNRGYCLFQEFESIKMDEFCNEHVDLQYNKNSGCYGRNFNKYFVSNASN